MRKNKQWSLLKHILFSGIASLIVFLLYKLIPSSGEASSIGIIGGADGPTFIYLPSNIKLFIIRNIIFPFIIFIVIMLLYKPLKRIIERNK